MSMNSGPPPTTQRSQTADTSSTISDGSIGNGDLANGGVLSSFLSGRHSSNSDSLYSLGELREKNGIDKLLPPRIRSRRRRKKEQREAEEAARGRAVAERMTLEDMPRDIEGEMEAGSARTDDVEGDRASLLILESEESPLVAPPLKSHPSHSGYLTTSSPLIKSSHVPNNAPPAQQSSATTFPTKSPAAVRLSPSTTASTPALTTASLQAPHELKPKRSASPVGRLREAFTPRQAPSPSSSPERRSRGSTPVRKEKQPTSIINRRGSVAARLGSIFPDRQSPQQSPEVQTVRASPERLKTPKAPYMIETNGRPSTPPTTIENAAPAIVNTPPTPTEAASPRFSGSPSSTNPNVVTSPSGNMISHRHIRSGSITSGNSIGPSKLSNITSAPLTPTPENGSVTPGNTQQTGFFSSVFSAAQNAANTLTNSINTTLPGQQRARSNTQETVVTLMDDVEVESIDDNRIRSDSEAKEPAVKTLGMGDLSLSHLGIVESTSASNTPTTAKFNDNQLNRGRAAMMGPEDTARSGAASPVMTAEKVDLPPMNGEGLHTKTWPVFEPSVAGDHSPQNGSIFDGRTGIGRSNSIRSALRESTRRKRGSSAATGTTLGAGLATGAAATPKVTGFAVASKKRNRDFHQLFRSVPDDDYLIEDYSCALQREILAHGRLYVSEGHLCFNSNIFGWVTTLVMSFDEIVSVEKRSTALVFKNGLMISTLHSKNIFASFTSRDSTYDLIVDIWKLGHPSLRSSLNGVRIDETGGGDKTEKEDCASVSGGSGSESDMTEDGVYDEDDDGDDALSFSARSGSFAASEGSPEKPVPRKAFAAAGGSAAERKEGSPVGSDAPGPATHAPTECSDQDTHYDKILADEVVPAPLGKVYNLMFGPASAAWMSRWLTVDQKCTELTMEDKRGLGGDTKTRTFSYIKPLNGAIGPRQTKCVITETLDAMDLEKAVSVTVSTQTPDVPSGNVFTTKTKYCLSWAEGGGTRLQMNCTIEWTGKSWLRGPIEKGANDGQTTYARDILAALRTAISHPTRTTAAAGGRKRKTRKSTTKTTPSPSRSPKPTAKKADWGVLEPLHGILGPVADVFGSMGSANMVYGLLVGLLVAAWFGFGERRGGGGMERWGGAERMVAYDEVWRREESELWEWLEERVGKGGGAPVVEREAPPLDGGREMDVAIRVTEEKLRALKGAVEKRKRV
ncbi:hypothetical protein VC83_03499 [Pseudogymnoascus destructans]|uniref:VASt domain-containing protein n=2 Tax=Pseudogymnoascus destructans TaxID=655981 RepID=L8FQZ8_PSED2|nr:uncharacterized protein VC83_03499 [Pseudogymnoascus destructans]ELR02974.1 hypothetical protein GMDG_05831 [Pseudogymnoascus destructans 20631-21]OAF60510.1 hypothetical protein VC83_03499 [Pseudogymnoascus destructans]